jgi:hypothetical protein
VGRVVVAVTRLMVAVREDGEMTLGMRRHQFRLCARIMKRLFASVKLQVSVVLRSPTEAFCTRMALAATVMS